MFYIPWIHNLVKVTGYRIYHKNTKHNDTKYHMYFTYSIEMLHQIHYVQLITRLWVHFKCCIFINKLKGMCISVYCYSAALNCAFQLSHFWVYCWIFWLHHSTSFSESMKDWQLLCEDCIYSFINTMYGWICLKLFLVICSGVH